MSGMKTIEVALTEAEYEETVRLAASRGITGEQLMRQAMRVYAIEESSRAKAAREFGEIVAGIQDDAAQQGLHFPLQHEVTRIVNAGEFLHLFGSLQS